MSTSSTLQSVAPVSDSYESEGTTHIGEGVKVHAQDLKRRLIICIPFWLIAMLLSMVPAWQFVGWQWGVAIASIPVTTWGAWTFHKAAFAAGRHGSTTMDTLVSLGVTASSLWSWWALLFGGAGELGMRMSMTLFPRAATATHHAEIYFEGACTITVFLLTGRWMEARARYRAGNALRALLESGAKEATKIEVDPATGARHEVVVPAASLQVGDMFIVRPGEKVATDGIVVEGQSALDISLLTGESVPEDISVGDEVTGATINTWGALAVKATRVGADTTFARIGAMVSQAQASKAPVQRLADRLSGVFVPVVIGIALATLIGWLIAGASLQAAFTAGVAVLVVACPCALGLATPTALMVGSGRASQLGIVIKSAETLEQTRTIDTIVLDKTGTVTTGKMSLESIVAPPELNGDRLSEDIILSLAAAVESASEHPIARAIVSGASARGVAPSSIRGFSNHAGLGVSALVDTPSGGDSLVLVGRASWLDSLGVTIPYEVESAVATAEASGATAIMIAQTGQWSDSNEAGHAHSATAVESVADSSTSESAETSLDVPGLTAPAPLATITMNVQGMTCASCVRRVERKLGRLDGVSASVNLATESATITLTEPHTDEELETIVNNAGYQGTVLWRTDVSASETSMSANTEEKTTSAQRILPERIEGYAYGVLVVRDTVKDTSQTAIEQFKGLGIEPILLTGDNEAAAQHVAQQVGISRVISQVMPEKKFDIIKGLQDEGRVVAMVGDGVNDAAALAQAGAHGLGIAMGSGTDVAIEVADITLVNSDLTSAATAIRISRRTLRIIKGNLFWAFAYNVAMIPLAIAGLLNPMLASAAMAFSSVFVVLNSLRLRSAQ
ncbi:MAG: HAD-IC family P-type ATPase [Schaalia turicensis]|nr:HAD-IC family P-type ATPase [Schaalia turicensis]